MHPTLIVDAAYGNVKASEALADAIRAQRKARVSSITLDTDHGFSDHRIALAAVVIDWLEQQAGPKP